MPWTDRQHAAAVRMVETGLEERRYEHNLEVDDHPRVIEALALENAGNRSHPRTRIPLSGRRLDRALTSGRYDRWATIVWRARLAETLARSIVRRQAFASDDPLGALEDAGLISRQEAQARADALRDGTATPLSGNRAARRARQRGQR